MAGQQPTTRLVLRGFLKVRVGDDPLGLAREPQQPREIIAKPAAGSSVRRNSATICPRSVTDGVAAMRE